jgi:hypothetical protein
MRAAGSITPAIAALALAALLLSGARAQTESVAVESATVETGQDATVQLQVLGVGPPGLGAWTIDIAYDATVLSVVECDEDAGSVCNPQYPHIEDTVRVTGAGGVGQQGDIRLATVTFSCDAEGSSPLVLTVGVLTDATPGAPQPIDAAAENGVIACVAGAEPTATVALPSPTAAAPTTVPTRVPTVAPAPTVGGPPPAGVLACDDFQYRQEAQDAYDEDPSGADGLDEDGDGEACEALPVLTSGVAGTSNLPNTGSGSDGLMPPGFRGGPYQWAIAGLVGAGIAWLSLGMVGAGWALHAGRRRAHGPAPSGAAPGSCSRLSAAHQALAAIGLTAAPEPTWRHHRPHSH